LGICGFPPDKRTGSADLFVAAGFSAADLLAAVFLAAVFFAAVFFDAFSTKADLLRIGSPYWRARSVEQDVHVSTHTEIVDAYMDGFRRSDKPAILALLTDDVAWDLPGFRHLTGKADFEGEIVNPQFEEHPTLVVDRKVEEGDTVVCIGEGAGQEFRFAFCDVFTFRGDLIGRVESYIVPLTGPSIGELANG
jgi:uncharacterized protein